MYKGKDIRKHNQQQKDKAHAFLTRNNILNKIDVKQALAAIPIERDHDHSNSNSNLVAAIR